MYTFSRKYQRIISVILLLIMMQSIVPTRLLALTSGPAQPETQQFAPAGMDNMVDPFTGDFSYNVPLMDVGGYPVTLNYAAGITPDQEASWVGLGWNLNVGAINRTMRGLPDDFGGENVTKEYNTKANQTFGLSGDLGFELYGFEAAKLKIGFSGSIFYNTYNGVGTSVGINPSVAFAAKDQPSLTANMGVNASLGSESGLSIAPSAGIGYKMSADNSGSTLNATTGFAFSTREGLKNSTLGIGASFAGTPFGVSASIGYSTPTYTPFIEHNNYNISGSLKFAAAIPNAVIDGVQVGVSGFYNGEFLSETERTIPAYGYMYSGLSSANDKLMDFNREKDQAFHDNTTNLPLTNFTHDIFNVSGEGVSGSYRLYRGDVGSVHDATTTNTGNAPSVGVEIGAGGPPPTIKVGVDGGYTHSSSYSGAWKGNANGIKGFNPQTLNTRDKEMAYFKRIGELAPETDCEFYNDVQLGYSSIRHDYDSNGDLMGDGNLTGNYVDRKNGSINKMVDPNNKRRVRRLRESVFTTLTAEEAKDANVVPIQNYAFGDFTWNNKTTSNNDLFASDEAAGYAHTIIERVSNNRKSHHISEVRVTNKNGARYIYGIPVYNNFQEEVTFAVPTGSDDNIKRGLINYTPDGDNPDNSKNNNKGLDHYFDKVKTPGYAHSYLLTSILSDDYIDSDNIPGPSDGDRGTYTKFNYSKLENDFKWRTPFSKDGNEGSYSQGLLENYDDDKANYIYGEKEIWYLHSIETRTHVAEFHLLDRNDAYGVAGENGGVGEDSKQKYIDKIILYSKPDMRNSDPEPIKTVHFEYDYSLCKNIPNNINYGDGKLTLKKVWFTYGRSEKGVLNPYVFNYADQDFDGTMDVGLNPDYTLKNYDRWGNYKPDLSLTPTGNVGDSNAEFPYVKQDVADATKNAAVYALSSIQTPTGGTIRVYYESDDYGYVQDKRAMRMFKLKGVSADDLATDNGNNILYTGTSGGGQKEYLVVDLGEGFKPADASSTIAQKNEQFRKDYLSGIDLMYFKVLLKVLNSGGVITTDRREFVPGYAEIDIAGSKLVGDDNATTYTTAKIKLKKIHVDDVGIDVNPIVKFGWMFARLHLNRETYGNTNANSNQLKQVLLSLLNTAISVGDLFTNFATKMLNSGHSKEFTPERSFVRLNEPDKIKLGGGHRVKAIIMVDNWGLMQASNESAINKKQTAFYGQKYEYTLKENSKNISSGVAAYEPVIGGDENPFKLPVPQRVKVPWIAAKEFYLETPFGESFFPAPIVGYREVTVTPIKITAADLAVQPFEVKNLQGNGTGFIKQQFYTAYDFPTITSATDIVVKRHKPNIIFKFMKFDSHDAVSSSQGYAVELNDMHGKEKAKRIYPDFVADVNNPDAGPVAISEVEHTYKTTAGRLSNEVDVIHQDLTISKDTIGVDIDVVQDQRYAESLTIGGSIAVNVKTVIYGIFPVLVPTAFPDITVDQTRFRSVVTTKVINKCGVLESTTVKDNGSKITTKNLAWDSKTATVVLTESQNEFHDPVYDFTYPGHWAYQRTGLAAYNEGTTFNDFDAVKNTTLLDGDELYIKGVQGFYHANKPINGTLELIDKSGATKTLTSGQTAKVIRSGARNNATIPLGTIKTLVNPIANGNNVVFTEVVNAKMSEYKDSWDKICRCQYYFTEGGPEVIFAGQDASQEFYQPPNPFIVGEKGVLKPFRSWAYLTNRTHSNLNNNVNIRKDGTYTDFTPFWVVPPPGGGDVPPPNNTCTGKPDITGILIIDPKAETQNTKWQFIQKVEKYNTTGLAIEEKDPLDRFTMAQYGYGRNLQVATSNNSQYRETAFDGFEDYDYEDCEDDHLSWRSFKNNLTIEEAHTGRKSIRVPKNQKLKITKSSSGWCTPPAPRPVVVH
jgi:hypothetical protein